MYEQREVPVLRRILWIMFLVVLGIVVLAIIAWAVFFRGGDDRTATQRPGDSQTKTSDDSPSDASSTGTVETPDPAASNTTTNQPTASSATKTQQPAELVNTGAGDVVSVVAGAAVVGGVAYHVRLRRKLVH